MSRTTTHEVNTSKIVGIQFSILSPDEIRKGSVAEINSRDTYINNKPVIGGLFDPRMGVLEPGLICPTDGLDYMQTPGYFGHVELARPVFFIQYLSTVQKVLRCVCFKCSKLLVSKEKYSQAWKMPNDARWKYVFPLANKVKRCGEDTEDGCGCLQPNKIKKEGLASLFAEWKDTDLTIKLTPELVLKIFKRISDEDVSFMGFSPIWSRPDWMVCQVMAVPPPAVRPSVKHDAQQRSEDDLTHILVNIIKTNKTLQEKIQNNAPANVIDDWTTVLQYYVATQVDNKIPGVAAVAQRSGRPLKSIKDRLNGKGGRMRGNLMAKRVDFSARSVITADPNISIRELGIPMKIAKNITKPVTVNAMNRAFLLKLVRNGPDVHPGARILEKRNGESITLRYIDRKSIVLEEGDTVHRHMMDGDIILFNRQPTLHRMSMMGHIARIMERGDTFRMNVGCTKSYNADFDGDEMNLHMAQDNESEAELLNLAAVPYQIISPASNKSIIGIFQDSLLGCFRFTRENIRFTPREAMNLLMMFHRVNEKELLVKKDSITSFDILSQILPPMTLNYKTKMFKDSEDAKKSNHILEIRNGKYIRGQMDKSVIEAHTKGLIQRICNDFGNMASAHFIDDIQNIITEYMKSSAFSVGISDLKSDNKTNQDIIQRITDKKNQVKTLIDQIQLGIFQNDTGKSNHDEFESQVNNILNQASAEAGKIGLESLNKNNRFVIMVNAGSKGSELNISQMISCLGQQNVDGKRIPYGFEQRTLPHFSKFDDSPGARGFVESSYINGLTPQELFFHAMGGRVGLIDTAVKSVTWETPVVVIQSGRPLWTEIGAWIDARLKKECHRVQYFPKDRRLELLELDTEDIFIPTVNAEGHVTWGPVVAMTRHDPGEFLYQITTRGGRQVTVTESKSLLVWNESTCQFLETSMSEVVVGDFVPVTLDLPCPSEQNISIDRGKDSESESESVRSLAKRLAQSEPKNVPAILFVASPDTCRVFYNEFKQYMKPSYQSRCFVEGIVFIMSRLGLFGCIQVHPENDGYSLSDDVSDPAFGFRIHNQVVLDPIVSIVRLPSGPYTKVYDLTIPDTFNFGLANGLQVRDTSSTGYIQRRLIKALEDLKVEYDMTIRTNKNKIVQFAYGDDGIDTVKVENQSLPIVSMSVQEIYLHYMIPDTATSTKEGALIFEKNTWKRMKKQTDAVHTKSKFYTDMMIDARSDIIQYVFKNKGDSVVSVPVAFSYIIGNIQGQQNINSNSMVDITLLEAYEMIEAAYYNLEQMKYVKPTRLFKILYYYNLSPKDLLYNKRFNRAALMILLNTIAVCYKRAIVAPGEMVGMIAGQSMGEISTQMTLNTFHYSGVASKSNVTRGVPRIEEILSLSSEPKNPSLTIHLKPDDETDKDKAHSIMYMIEHTKLQEIVQSIEICFDPDDLNTLINEDKATMEQYRAFEAMVDECANAADTEASHEKSKWLIRMEMDPEIMLEKNITMDDVHFTLNNSYTDEISCIYSDYNADKLIFRIRMNNIVKPGLSRANAQKKTKANPLDQSDQIYILKNFQDELLNNVVLRGIKGIQKVSMRKIKDNMVDQGGVFKKQDIWVLDTIGTNLLDVLGLDYLDSTRIYSNNIVEVYDVLGIEAARQTIYNEIVDVIEFDGTYVNYHHFSVLCDRMTFASKMISIFRHGINNDNIGPIAKASFEETPEMFLKAARHAELDTMRGVSANVMCGQEGFFGTSAFQVVLDLEAMKTLEEEKQYENPEDDMIDKMFQVDSGDDTCGTTNMTIQNNVISIKPLDLGKETTYNPGF